MKTTRFEPARGGRWLLLPALLFALVSCYPGQPEDISQLDTVVTLYDDTVDFTSFSTYAMPDSVNHFCPDSTGQSCIDVSRQFDQLMLQTVATNMQALGYTREFNPSPGNEPDVLITVAVTASKNWIVSGGYPWYPWWGWYPCCWGPGWNPWYPPYWTASSYEVGTILITMVDVDGAASENIPVSWTGILNGLLGTQASATQSRIVDGINQAFDQSPYLNTD
jgi:hypothetical protein